MCIIVYKPQGVDFPTIQTIQTCFASNPDGAGFMTNHDGRVHIYKGFMTYDDFAKALDTARKKYGDDGAWVLHFRISTQAHGRADCTHPFPLSAKMDDLRFTRCNCAMGIAHNGIISLTSTYSKTVDYSDTMKFITDYLSLIITKREYYKDNKTLTLIERLCGSKLAILDGTGHCELIGDGWAVDDGVYYSNTSYKVTRYTTANTFCGGKWWDYADKFDDYVGNFQTDWQDDDYVDMDEDEAEYYKKIDECYNPQTGLYDFDDLDCPCLHGDDEWCEVCKNYYKCYGKPRPIAHYKK